MEAEDFTTEAQRGISATDWGKSLPQKTTKKGKKRRGILTAKYANYVELIIMWSSAAGPLISLGNDRRELHIIVRGF